MQHPEQMIVLLLQWQNIGIGPAIDDSGTAHSLLSHHKRLQSIKHCCRTDQGARVVM